MDRPILLLTKTAIADARGVCFEYAPRRIIRERNTLETAYFPHHKFGTGGGRYSDDAQMSLAVAECLLANGPDAAARNYAHHFVEAFKREAEPREGYASAFQAFLIEIVDTDDFLARIRPESDKSGAAMRAGPCGLLGSVKAVMDAARVQAAVTHDTPDGIAAAQAAALMVHYGAYRLGARSELPALLDHRLPGHDWRKPHKGEVGPKGLDSVRAALTALLRNDRLDQLIIDCVDFGGDVDTVAAIAAAAASTFDDMDQSIPYSWWDGVENGLYGRDYLSTLDLDLQAFAREQGAPR
jgi:ADP-ribosyl-[dinitrogen reductase] hydrolase